MSFPQGSDDESESEIYPISPDLRPVSASPSFKHEAGPTSPPPPADTTITVSTVDTTAAAAPTTATTAAITAVAAVADAATANGSATNSNAADVIAESAEDDDGIAEKSGGGAEGDVDRGCTEEQPQEDAVGNKASFDASSVDGVDGGGSGEIAQGNEGIVSTGDSSGEGRAMAPCSDGKVKPGHNRRCSGSSSGSRSNDGGVGVSSGGVGVAPGCHSAPAPRATPAAGIAAAAAAAAANNAVAALAAEKYFSMFSRRDPQVAATTAVARSALPPGVAPADGKADSSSARAPGDNDDHEMEEN